MIDDRTENLDLPLPHAENDLAVDVERLRQAITSVDAKFGELDALLQSDDATLDQVQELVAAIKANRDVLAVLGAKADAAAFTVQEEVQALTDGQTVVNLAALASTAGCAVFIEGVRLNKNQWEKDAVVSTRLILAAPYPAGHTIAVTRQQGGL